MLFHFSGNVGSQISSPSLSLIPAKPFIATIHAPPALAGISEPDPLYEIKRPNSDTYSIEYVYSGEGTIQENDSIYNVSAGDFFILHPNKYHHYYSNKKKPWRKIWLVINGDTHFPTNLLSAFSIPEKIYFPKINSPLELENIFELLKSNTPDPTIKLERLIFSLIQALGYSGSINSAESRSLIPHIKDYIDKRLNTKIDINKICTVEFSTSPEYFSRAFKKMYGISPSQYILQQKIDLAKMLLDRTDLPVHEISDRLAFFDAAHFSRSFKKIYNMSPKKYRENSKIATEAGDISDSETSDSIQNQNSQ